MAERLDRPLPERPAPSLATVPAAAKNTTAAVIKTFNDATWDTVRRNHEYKVMTFRIRDVKASQYIRLRGTNLPPSVPFETDADGNPLPDLWTNATAVSPTDVATAATASRRATSCGSRARWSARICPTTARRTRATAIDGCPNHLPVKDGVKYVAFDVAAWADLWFYSNPIFIEVRGSTMVAGVDD